MSLTWLAGLRAALGAGMLARPSLLPGLLGLDSATVARTEWLVRMLGAREVALGVGAAAALRSGQDARDARDVRRWVAAGAFSDLADALAVGAAVRAGRLSRPVGALGAATALGAGLVGVRGLLSRTRR